MIAPREPKRAISGSLGATLGLSWALQGKNFEENNLLEPKFEKIISRYYDINKIEFSKKITNVDVGKQSFIYKTLSGVRAKINDPLGKKRGSITGK